MRETIDSILQRKPMDRLHVARKVADRLADRVHAPELDDLRPPARLIGQRAEEFMDGHPVSGFLQHLAASRGDRILAGRELSLRKPPRAQLTQLNDSELWSAIVAQHDSAGRQDRYTGFDLALLHRLIYLHRDIRGGTGFRRFLVHLNCFAKSGKPNNRTYHRYA